MRVGVPHGLRGIAPRAGVAGDAGVVLSSLCVVVVFGRGGCVGVERGCRFAGAELCGWWMVGAFWVRRLRGGLARVLAGAWVGWEGCAGLVFRRRRCRRRGVGSCGDPYDGSASCECSVVELEGGWGVGAVSAVDACGGDSEVWW